MLRNRPIKRLRGNEVEIKDNKCNTTPGLQKVFTITTYDAAKSMNDTEKVVFRDILQRTSYYIRKPTKSRLSGRERYIKNDLDNDVIKILI